MEILEIAIIIGFIYVLLTTSLMESGSCLIGYGISSRADCDYFKSSLDNMDCVETGCNFLEIGPCYACKGYGRVIERKQCVRNGTSHYDKFISENPECEKHLKGVYR